MNNVEVLRFVYQGLRQYFAQINQFNATINDVVLDGEGEESEVVITLDDGKEMKDFVIRAADITEAERNS